MVWVALQVIPFDEMDEWPKESTAQKSGPLAEIATAPLRVIVWAVQVVPSGEVAAAVPPEVTAQKTEPFQAMADQEFELGIVCVFQVMPSVEVAAFAVPVATAQNTVPFQAKPAHDTADGSV